jgi:hypothetical protein
MYLCVRVIDFACTKPRVSGHVFRVIDFACTKPGELTIAHKYMTAHSPGLVQAKSITIAHKYMTAHSPGLVQAKSITLNT